jgi:hypothetical protein
LNPQKCAGLEADLNQEETGFRMNPMSEGELKIGSETGTPSSGKSFFGRRLQSAMWKIWPQPRIKAVIVGDTTYGIYLLTGTISGSKFAIPDDEFHLTGMGRNSEQK